MVQATVSVACLSPHLTKLSLMVGPLRNWLFTAFAFYICYEIYDRVVLDKLGAWLDEEVENMTDEELEEELAPLFIALPFTTEMEEPKPYKGTDPEWQDFMKVAHDKELKAKIIRGLTLTHPVQGRHADIS
jgi:hypothetical protein